MQMFGNGNGNVRKTKDQLYTLCNIESIDSIDSMETEMCNRPRLVIDLVIDYDFFQSNRNRNRSFLQNCNRNRNRNPVKKICV